IGAIFAHEKRFWDGGVRSASGWSAQTLGGVAGKVLGIAGMGAIGAEAAKMAQAVGLKVVALTKGSALAVPGVTRAESLADLFSQSDHLVLTMPLTDETRGIVDSAMLSTARPGLHLINVARGALIDQEALIMALDAGHLSAATLDVTEPEPLPPGHALYSHPKVRLTPHVSGSCEAGEARTSSLLCENLTLFLAGLPIPYTLARNRGY
ncbi:MAG: glyoxylate reductase (NADP(+)), partial [Rhodobacteraceae bacterium]|nr:glyoxylate reductase (NADP(+)) [Paracoccaceae bacterium]